MKSKRNDINIADECKRLMNFHVMLFLKYGIELYGIIQDINDEGVLVLVGEDVFKNPSQNTPNRQNYMYRRYKPRFFPFAALATTYIMPYSYYTPFFLF
nr:hypothetical protein [uncultured Romboutsia sp.]